MIRPAHVFKLGTRTNGIEPGWYVGQAMPENGPYETEQEAWNELIAYATRGLEKVKQ